MGYNMTKLFVCLAAILAGAMIFTSVSTTAQAAGLQAELRSSAAILPSSITGAVAPTAPAGGAAIGTQAWVCDARQGFAPAVAVETGVGDPLLAMGTTGGVRLP